MGDKHVLVSLAQGGEFHEVQYYFHLATTLRWALWVGTLVLAIGAVLLDPKRRRAGFWLGIGVACSCVVMLALLNTGKQYAMAHSTTPQDVTNARVLDAHVVAPMGAARRRDRGAPGGARSCGSLGLRSPPAACDACPPRGASARATPSRACWASAPRARSKTHGTSAIDWIGAHGIAFAWLGVAVGGIVLAAWASSLLGAAVVILLVVAWFSAMVSLKRRVSATAPPHAG